MKTDVKIKELEEKIQRRTKALASTLQSQIAHKNEEISKTLEKSIKKEKSEIKRTTSKFLEKVEIMVKEQTDKITKLKAKIEKVTSKLEELEKRASFKSIEEIKMQVNEELRNQLEKYDRLKSEQKRIYKHEFESLNAECADATQIGLIKLKKLL